MANSIRDLNDKPSVPILDWQQTLTKEQLEYVTACKILHSMAQAGELKSLPTHAATTATLAKLLDDQQAFINRFHKLAWEFWAKFYELWGEGDA